MTTRSARRRDEGTNLIDVIVTISIIGTLSVVLLGGISVIFRTKDGVADVVTEAHDLQQAISYVPRDVQAGPWSPDGYLTQNDANPGSGCAADGTDNVLRIDHGDSFVAYRVVPTDTGVARLDRYECEPDGTVTSTVNIADRLIADGAEPPAEAYVLLESVATGPLTVDRVRLRLNQSDGTSDITGSPRAEADLPAVVDSLCATDPMEETLGFATFVRGDVRLVNNPQVKWASAVGGTLSFSNSANIGQNINSDDELPTLEPFGTALYIHDIDWDNSSGTLSMHSNRDVVIDDRTNTDISPSGKTASALTGTSTAEIRALGSSQILPVDEVLDFDQAFETLRACSYDMAQLLDGACTSCATELTILDQNASGPYPGIAAGTNMKLELVEGKANVLNIFAADFAAMQNMSFVGAQPSQDTPFIVNIMDEGDIVLNSYPGQGGIGSWVASTVWNFPRATTVTLDAGNDGVWGTVYAPSAHVVSSVKIEGGVVAARWTHDGREVNGPRVFTGLIDWAG